MLNIYPVVIEFIGSLRPPLGQSSGVTVIPRCHCVSRISDMFNIARHRCFGSLHST